MASRSFKGFIEQEFGKFPHFLIYAILEWIMILLLFIDGFLAFVANEFAKLFELKVPCLLCTRIDHILVRRKPDFYYNDSICEAHKMDVSSLAYCHIHRKLSDIRKMCEGCLLSFATENKSDGDNYRSLVGILHKDLECLIEDENKIKSRKEELKIEKSSVHRCSCCGEALRIRSSFRNGIAQGQQAPAPFSSPRTPFSIIKNDETHGLELPHIRYTELKFMAGNESEILEAEEGSNSLIPGKEDVKAATVPLLPESEDLIEDKTPSFIKGNKFFGIALSDSATSSPRWATTSTPTARLMRKSPLFASDSTDGKLTSELDGDSILNRLKKQVRLDRKSLISLYMELDEERSASAVAANNAMAMITRLQAEKAAVQMEALQYQRMMEEQAEYDQEALQVMKDLVSKRDEEIKGLEAQLETYREKYKSTGKIVSLDCQESQCRCYFSFSERSDCGSLQSSSGEYQHDSDQAGLARKENGEGPIDESLLDFESERIYFLDQLRNLRKKLHSSKDDGSDIVNPHDEDTGDERNALITREMLQLSERLGAIEADSGFLKHAVTTLQRGSEGTKLLAEIAQQLRKLHYSDNLPSEEISV